MIITKLITYKTGLNINESYEAKSLEAELRKVMEEKSPITSISPEIFTERKEGVMPEYDIRTDKWEVAEKAMEKVSQTQIAARKKADKTEDKLDVKTDKKAGENTVVTPE